MAMWFETFAPKLCNIVIPLSKPTFTLFDSFIQDPFGFTLKAHATNDFDSLKLTQRESRPQETLFQNYLVV
jgi:hypothetical protein